MIQFDDLTYIFQMGLKPLSCKKFEMFLTEVIWSYHDLGLSVVLILLFLFPAKKNVKKR